MTKIYDLQSAGDFDEEDDAFSGNLFGQNNLPDTAQVLAELLVTAQLSKLERDRILEANRLTVIKTPDAATADILKTYWKRPIRVDTRTDRNSSKQTVVEDYSAKVRSWLSAGNTVVLISQAPERFLSPELLRAADAHHTVALPSVEVARRLVHRVTGSPPRLLTEADIEGLSVDDILFSVRPQLSAKTCVQHLRRRPKTAPTSSSDKRKLSDLVLTGNVRHWAERTLIQIRQAEADELSLAALPYSILTGAPGTGKTTIAAALARSAGWEFSATSIGAWFAQSDGHLGDVVKAAAKFFDSLHQSERPIVALIDELDALPNRMAMQERDRSWWTTVVTFVLTEIDRLRKSGKPILLLGATNHPDGLDPALVRAGRLENQVLFALPNLEERANMFGTLLPSTVPQTDLSVLARLSVTATPAQIEGWCTAALHVAQQKSRAVTAKDVVTLIAPKDSRDADTDWTIALHEAGHAIVAMELGLQVTEVSILDHGNKGGWVSAAGPNPMSRTKEDIERIGTMLLGGRAADIVRGKGANTGAQLDLAEVNSLLRYAMTEACLYDNLQTMANIDPWRWNGTTLSSAINAKLTELSEAAIEIVNRRASEVEAMAERLIYERVIINPIQLGAETSDPEILIA